MCRSRKAFSSDVSIFVFNKKPVIFWSGHYKFILDEYTKPTLFAKPSKVGLGNKNKAMTRAAGG
jgi:hypothetical protein